MKSQSLLLFAPLAAALAIEPRQLGGGLGGAAAGLLTSGLTAMLKDTKPLKIEEGPSTMKMPGAKYMKITFGPYELLPAKEAAKQFNPTKMDKSSNAYQFIAKGFPGGAIVLRTNTTLEYEDGTYAGVSNNVYNHHVMFMDTTKSSSAPLMCAGASASQKMPVSTFAGVSAEAGPTYFSDKEGGFKSGYHLGKDNKILMTAEIVNYASEKKTVYVVAEVDYVDGNTPGVTDTSVSMLSVTQCDESAKGIVAPPADKKVFGFESKKLIAMQDGWILTRRGHMHDGGKNMVLKVNGKMVCNSEAIYDGSQSMKNAKGDEWKSLSGMIECYDPVRVQRGDAVTIEAHYNLELHPLREHAHGEMADIMGLMTFAFAQDNTGTAKST